MGVILQKSILGEGGFLKKKLAKGEWLRLPRKIGFDISSTEAAKPGNLDSKHCECFMRRLSFYHQRQTALLVHLTNPSGNEPCEASVTPVGSCCNAEPAPNKANKTDSQHLYYEQYYEYKSNALSSSFF
jgi:hypothetical protein